MISYAQNFEDVMLARAFGRREQGFYIDIGVWDAAIDSVTKHFYDLGWSGVNVEPLTKNHAAIAQARPRDININAAVSSSHDPIVLHHVVGTGLSTSSSEYAGRHAAQGYAVEPTKVNTIGLAELCERHAAGRCIDFIKIDVEGAEADVVSSGDWARFRPQIAVVEATEPNRPIASFAEWEPMLLAHDYQFVYFDGLNRWYVRAESPELLPAFACPPNPFDGYVMARVARLEGEQAELRKLGRLVTRIESSFISRTLLRIANRLAPP